MEDEDSLRTREIELLTSMYSEELSFPDPEDRFSFVLKLIVSGPKGDVPLALRCTLGEGYPAMYPAVSVDCVRIHRKNGDVIQAKMAELFEGLGEDDMRILTAVQFVQEHASEYFCDLNPGVSGRSQDDDPRMMKGVTNEGKLYDFGFHQWSGRTRPCSFSLVTGDVAFLDFERVDDRLKIVRASFDGYGCCNCGDRMAPMDKDDSTELLRMVEAECLDQERCRKIVVRYCMANSPGWHDALDRHGLLLMGFIPLQVKAQQEEGGLEITCYNLAGEILGRLADVTPQTSLCTVISVAHAQIAPPQGYLWKMILPSGTCLNDSDWRKSMGELLSVGPFLELLEV